MLLFQSITKFFTNLMLLLMMINFSRKKFLLRVSYIEVYNEIVRELLDPETPTLKIRESPTLGPFVKSQEELLNSFEGFEKVLAQGGRNRGACYFSIFQMTEYSI